MVPRIHARGTSFKGASAYLLHDKGQDQQLGTSFKGAANYLLHDKHATTSERVAWTHGVNLWSESPDQAWFEMMDTWRERKALKRAAGVKQTGRDNKAPVLHLSLSWHPDETPSPEHMKETALAALKALGLQEHQAMLVAHNDEPQPHVHLLVNTVHPVTGKTADLNRSKETLSRWAEAYEREHGQIRCEERVKNNARRAELRQERQAERAAAKAFNRAGWWRRAPGKAPDPPKPYEPVRDRSPSRGEWFDKQAVIDRMKGLRAEQTAGHRQERSALSDKHQAQLDGLDEATKARVETVRQNIRGHYRPEWTQLYRRQTTERRILTRTATHPFERACYVIANRDRLAGAGKPLNMRQIAALIFSPKRLMQTVDRMHERERRGLAQVQKTHQKGITDRIWTEHRAQNHQVVAQHEAERTALKAHQALERNEVTFARAKDALAAERAAAERAQAPAPAPSPVPPARETRAEQMARRMREVREMRKRGRGRDTYGREME